MLFDVLEMIYSINRAGIPCTATTAAKALKTSEYRFRQIAHSCAEINLLDWRVIPHRPNVSKRDYVLTAKGRRVLYAFLADSPTEKKEDGEI